MFVSPSVCSWLGVGVPCDRLHDIYPVQPLPYPDLSLLLPHGPPPSPGLPDMFKLVHFGTPLDLLASGRPSFLLTFYFCRTNISALCISGYINEHVVFRRWQINNRNRRTDLLPIITDLTTTKCQSTDSSFQKFTASTKFHIYQQLTYFKVVLYDIDVTAMCSVTKCKQSCLIDHFLHS